jgi:release factor glutamine methyltransferase
MTPMTDNPTLDQVLREIEAILEPLGTDARREAQSLAAARLGVGRSALVLRADETVGGAIASELRDWARRRAAGEPHAYIIGHREFWSLDLVVTRDVLVPRPETELLVERALFAGSSLAAAGDRLAVLDLGTGSGAIALALARERPAWRVTATDASAAALRVARINAGANGTPQVEFIEGHWFAPLGGRRFDLIVSNPPYVAGDDPVLEGDSLRFEPRSALTPGADALAALREIVAGSPALLRAQGWLLLEHGADQGPALRSLLVAAGFAHVRSHRDLAGHERVTEAQRR